MITNLCPRRSEVDQHLTQNPSSGPKLRPLGRAPTTRGTGRGSSGARPGRLRPSASRGVHFPIYRAPTAQFRIFSSVLPYSVLGCNNSQFGQRLQTSTLYCRTLTNIRKCFCCLIYLRWTPATGAQSAWACPQAGPPGPPCGRGASQRSQLGYGSFVLFVDGDSPGT